MVKKLCTFKYHSIVDSITNSSSELFCKVKGDKEVIETILDGLLKDMKLYNSSFDT